MTQILEVGKLSAEEWKMVIGSEGPCISILQPVHPATPRTSKPVRLKKAIESVEQILLNRLDPSLHRQLLDPLYEFEAGDRQAEDQPGSGLVIFRSPRVFQHFYVSRKLDELVMVADHFYILPLLPLLNSGKIFYILALSQKHIRLLRCTPDSTEEVPLPAWVPRTLEDATQSDQPDHMLDGRSSAGPSTGSMKGVLFTTSNDREAKDEYMLHFYKAVDDGLNELLHNDEAPVVLAGVDYELALYRRITAYRRIAPDGVHGAPDGLKGGELRRRAQDLADASFAEPLDQALKAYERLGPERRSADWKEAVNAAYDGRVAHLFITEGAKEFGAFDTAARTVQQHAEPHPGDEDLVNAAAVETLLHGGLVDILPQDKAPIKEPLAALLRY